LRITAAGKREHRQNITVAAGQETTIEATLEGLAPTAGAVKENPKDGLKYVWIPPGTFMMGCSPGDAECDGGEKPAHRVTISKGFWMGQTEVTVGAFKRFASATGRGMPKAPNFNPSWSNQQMPIVNVSWDDAEAYCRWAGGHLPSEAEWEYTARAGSTEPRYGPLDEVAWYHGNSGGRTHEVGQKRPNAFSLYDMLGDVWEWVSDWYDGSYYANSPEVDPLGPSSARSARHLLTSFSASGFRGLRGGSWSDKPRYVRASYRGGDYPGRDVVYGCRCVWEAGGP
jgi:formylglycine-generating enzyme required for sulfatase activity